MKSIVHLHYSKKRNQLKVLLGLLLFFNGVNVSRVQAQQYDGYSALTCSGEVPEEFRNITPLKVLQEIELATSDIPKQVRIDLLKDNFTIDELLISGQILFGDPVTDYINSVADLLLANQPVLQSQLRFYAVNNPDAFAFATTEGIVFITIGLIAQLENEAQLAFILACEITHFVKKHRILKQDLVLENIARNNRAAHATKLKSLSWYTQVQEFESDTLGFDLLASAGYDKYAALSSIDVLLHSELPFGELPFSTKFLEFDSFVFPPSLNTEQINNIPADHDDYNNSMITRNSIKSRRQILQSKIDRCQFNQGLKFLISESKFLEIQKIARFELVHLDLIRTNYLESLYSCLLLLEKYPDNKYLEESLAKSLYGLSKYRNKFNSYFKLLESEKLYGGMSALNRFMYKLEPEQLNLLAIRYTLYAFEKHTNPFVEKILDDLILEGIQSNELSWQSITTGVNTFRASNAESFQLNSLNNLKLTLSNSELDPVEMANESGSKYSKIREYRAMNMNGYADTVVYLPISNWEKNFHFMCFNSSLSTDLKNRFKRIESEYQQAKNAAVQSSTTTLNRYNHSPGSIDSVSKLMILEPSIFLVNTSEGFRKYDSEKLTLKFQQSMEQLSPKYGIEIDFISPTLLNSIDTERYNHFALMNGWYWEKQLHKENKIDIIPMQTSNTQALADIYGTKYFCYTGAFSDAQRRKLPVNTWVLSVIMWPALPFTVAAAFTPIKKSTYYFEIFDVLEGKEVLGVSKNTKSRMGKSRLKSNFEKVLLQIN